MPSLRPHGKCRVELYMYWTCLLKKRSAQFRDKRLTMNSTISLRRAHLGFGFAPQTAFCQAGSRRAHRADTRGFPCIANQSPAMHTRFCGWRLVPGWQVGASAQRV